MGKQWYAIRVKTGQEMRAVTQFQNQGFTLYYPQTIKCIRHAGQVKREPRAFFTGYLFLHLSVDERAWTKIRSTYGALGVVHFGSVYPAVPDAVIEMLQSREDDNGMIDLSKKRKFVSPFKEGEKVIVDEGACKGLEAVFLSLDGEQRAMILLNMLGGMVRTKVNLGALKSG